MRQMKILSYPIQDTLKSAFCFFIEEQTGVRGCSPYDGIATDLQVFEELLGLLSVSVLLFSGQGVIGNQQQMGPSS